MWAGQDDTQRFKTRVLKPPGGGSSDIFGSGPEETSPRRVKNHNQSQLGSALFGDVPNSSNNGNDTPRCTSKPGNDSYNRLFGPPDAPPTTPNAKNHMRSNISLSGDSSSTSRSPSDSATSPAKSTASSSSDSGIASGFAASNGNNNLSNDITDGNPVTGTGYTSEARNNGPAMQNGTTSSSSSSVGEKSTDSSPGAKAPARGRVPPGGYSSGLW